jgi:hypothetical protein
MPKFFFHVSHGGETQTDQDGSELPDARAAWHEAVASVGHSIRDLNGALETDVPWRLEVTGEQGQLVHSIEVRAIVKS